jgi:hypothetical protein
MPPSLDSTTYVANNGTTEQRTMREVIALGCGKTYDILSSKPYWKDLMAAYIAEKTDPLSVATKKLYKAYADMKSKQWWFNEGINQAPHTDEDWNEANDSYMAAWTLHEKLQTEQKRLVEMLDGSWAELHAHCGYYPSFPQDTVLQTIQQARCRARLPVYPWPQSEAEREVITFFADAGPNEDDEDESEASRPMNYPPQTMLTAGYIVADKPGLHTLKAVVTKDGVLQLKPRETFESVEEWVSSLPYVIAGSMTITLPKPTAGMKQRITTFAESIDSNPDLRLNDKIRAIYQEFGLKSFVTLGGETHDFDWTQDIDWATCSGVTSVTMLGRVVGRFARYPDLELIIVNKTKEPICPTSDTLLCVGGKMVNSLEDFRCGDNLIFQLFWKTPKGRRSAVFGLKYTA